MRLDSCRGLKREVLEWMRARAPRDAPALVHAVSAAVGGPDVPRVPGFAVGVQRRGSGYALSLRIQRAHPGVRAMVDAVCGWARGEVVVRTIGPVRAQAGRGARARPLRIGDSIGHYRVTAGTLGCFIERDGEEFILSNNHVLADENRGRRGDAILQPARLDGGRRPRDVVGGLFRFVRLTRRRPNLVDCAMARMTEGLEYYFEDLPRAGGLAGVRGDMPEDGEPVFKVGRTTGYREGYVSAVEMDNVVVGFGTGDLVFDNQIEIAHRNVRRPFSAGGDSGSLVFDARRRAVGLLFAGNDYDVTFANPIGAVLEALDARLVH